MKKLFSKNSPKKTLINIYIFINIKNLKHFKKKINNKKKEQYNKT